MARVRLAAIALFAGLVLLVSACSPAKSPANAQNGGAAHASKKTYTIGVDICNMPDPFHVSLWYGIQKKAKELGNVKLIMADVGGYGNLNRQISQLDDFQVKQVDAVIGCFVNQAGTKAAVDKLMDRGIPVIAFGSDTDGKKVTFISSNRHDIGEHMAEGIVKYVPANGKIVVLAGPAGATWAVDQITAFEAYLKQHAPGIQIIAKQWSPSSREDGLNLMQDMLQKFGDDIQGVYTASDAIGVGAARAIVSAGKKGKIALITSVMERDTEQLVRDGVIYMTAAQQAVLVGEKALEATVDYLGGKHLPDRVAVPDLVVTKDNINGLDTSLVRAPDNYKP